MPTKGKAEASIDQVYLVLARQSRERAIQFRNRGWRKEMRIFAKGCIRDLRSAGVLPAARPQHEVW